MVVSQYFCVVNCAQRFITSRLKRVNCFSTSLENGLSAYFRKQNVFPSPGYTSTLKEHYERTTSVHINVAVQV